MIPFLLEIYLFGFGTIIGSFLNVLIYRLPRKEDVVLKRSYCPLCSAPVRWYDNIPLFSFLILRGKCRRCQARISARYPLIELAMGLVFLGSFLLYDLSVQMIVVDLFFALLLVVTIIDFKHYLIPDLITLPGMLIGLGISFFRAEITPMESLIGLVVGGLSLYFLALAGDAIFKKESLGGGDIKLAAMLGAFLGWQNIIIIFFGGALLGLIYALIQMARSPRIRQSRMIPFGPFLSLSAVIALFFGDAMIDYYLHNILMIH